MPSSSRFHRDGTVYWGIDDVAEQNAVRLLGPDWRSRVWERGQPTAIRLVELAAERQATIDATIARMERARFLRRPTGFIRQRMGDLVWTTSFHDLGSGSADDLEAQRTRPRSHPLSSERLHPWWLSENLERYGPNADIFGQNIEPWEEEQLVSEVEQDRPEDRPATQSSLSRSDNWAAQLAAEGPDYGSQAEESGTNSPTVSDESHKNDEQAEDEDDRAVDFARLRIKNWRLVREEFSSVSRAVNFVARLFLRVIFGVVLPMDRR